MPVQWATAAVVMTAVLVITHVSIHTHIVTQTLNVPAAEEVRKSF